MPMTCEAAGPSPVRDSPLVLREMEPKDQPLMVSTLPHVPAPLHCECPLPAASQACNPSNPSVISPVYSPTFPPWKLAACSSPPPPHSRLKPPDTLSTLIPMLLAPGRVGSGLPSPLPGPNPGRLWGTQSLCQLDTGELSW